MENTSGKPLSTLSFYKDARANASNTTSLASSRAAVVNAGVFVQDFGIELALYHPCSDVNRRDLIYSFFALSWTAPWFGWQRTPGGVVTYTCYKAQSDKKLPYEGNDTTE